MRDITSSKSKENLESFMQKHIASFEDFKIKALDSLVEWH